MPSSEGTPRESDGSTSQGPPEGSSSPRTAPFVRGDHRAGDDATPGARRPPRDDRPGVNTDLVRLVAAAADLCRKPLRHAVIDAHPDPGAGKGFAPQATDRCLRLEVRSLQGERMAEEDLELEIYRSGADLNLTLAWLAFEERPVLWHGSHPVWMDGTTGQRCERPEGGAQLEALGRRLRALLVDTDH